MKNKMATFLLPNKIPYKFIDTFLAIWPRSQPNSYVSQRLSNRGSLSNSSQQKKTRRRVASMAQRRAANIRERRRMFNLNEAFDRLRRKVVINFITNI